MDRNKKIKWLRVGLAIFLVLAMLASVIAPLLADTLEDLEDEKSRLEDEVDDNREEQYQTRLDINETDEKINAVKQDLERLDVQINDLRLSISQLEGEIAEEEERHEALAAELTEVKKQEQKHYNELKERLRIMYEYGNVNYLELLFGARDLNDFFNRLEYIEEMARYDKNIQTELANDRAQVQTIESRQQQVELQLSIKRTELEKEQGELEAAAEEKAEAFRELESSRELYEAYLSKLKEEEEYLNALIAEKEEEIQTEKDRIAEEERRRQEEEERRRQEEEEGGSGGGGGGSMSSTGNDNPIFSPEIQYFDDDFWFDGGCYVSNTFTWPVPSSTYISSPFGYRVHPIYGTVRLHTGTDIATWYGADILAADEGTVIYVSYSEYGYGHFVMIQHPSGYVTLYAHCSSILVYSGQQVEKGERIALVGSTGDSTGPHCHFEVRLDGNYLNAMSFFYIP